MIHLSLLDWIGKGSQGETLSGDVPNNEVIGDWRHFFIKQLITLLKSGLLSFASETVSKQFT